MRRVLVLTLSLTCLACEPLATTEYPGEPIGRLVGTITSSPGQALPSAEVALLWVNWRTAPGTVVGTRFPVEGTFPAGFRAELYLPPPDEGHNALPPGPSGAPEPALGIAWIVVLRAGAAPPSADVITHAEIKGLHPGDVLGWAETFVLAHLAEDAPPGGFAARVLGGATARGFHLMRAAGRGGADLEAIRDCKARGLGSNDCRPTLDGLAPAQHGMDTEIDVRLSTDLSELLVPVFALPPEVEAAFGI